MSRRRKKTAEEREWTRRINAIKRLMAAQRGVRAHRVSFNMDELTLIIVTLALSAGWSTAEERRELYGICKRMWPVKDGNWVECLFNPPKPQADPTAMEIAPKEE